jgi:hypothetical protein
MEIERRLKAALADRGPFARVHPSPKSGSDVPDEDEVALVALAPEYPHDAKATVSKAVTAASEILGSRGAGARTNQNMLVFLAADSLRLAELTQAAREFLAWSSIVDDGEAGRLNLDGFQRSQAKSQRDGADQTAHARIPETYQWLLVPEQADPLSKVGLKPVKVSGSDALAVRAGAKLRNEELLITKFGGVNLRLVLDGALGEKWAAEGAFGLRQLWAWFAQYPYLPRLRDISVLEGAVRDGSSSLLWRTETFAYAAAREEGGEYRGVVAGRIGETPVTSTSLIVDGSVLPDPLPGAERKPIVDPGPGPGPEPPTVARIRRFHGEVALTDPRRPIPELTKIVDEVIGRLAQQTDVSLRVSVTVEAEHKGTDGFADDTVRTISENAKTLRFKDFGWDKE